MILADITSIFRAKIIKTTFSQFMGQKNRVLDVGCGNGVVSGYLASNLGLDTSGTDISNYLKRDLQFKPMTRPDKLPFQREEFDVVMFNDTLHHMTYANQEKLLNEARRVGKVILIFEVLPTATGKLADRLINFVHNSQMETPLTFRTETKWKSLFDKLKFKVKVLHVKRPLLYPFSHIAFVLK